MEREFWLNITIMPRSWLIPAVSRNHFRNRFTKRPASRTVPDFFKIKIFTSLLDQIALVNEYVVLYKSSNDVTICLVGRSEESNELLLYTAVETIYDALIETIK